MPKSNREIWFEWLNSCPVADYKHYEEHGSWGGDTVIVEVGFVVHMEEEEDA